MANGDSDPWSSVESRWRPLNSLLPKVAEHFGLERPVAAALLRPALESGGIKVCVRLLPSDFWLYDDDGVINPDTAILEPSARQTHTDGGPTRSFEQLGSWPAVDWKQGTIGDYEILVDWTDVDKLVTASTATISPPGQAVPREGMSRLPVPTAKAIRWLDKELEENGSPEPRRGEQAQLERRFLEKVEHYGGQLSVSRARVHVRTAIRRRDERISRSERE